jgi:serine/threonine protein kinase
MILGDKYRLREQVGEGGMGAIWTADHLALCVEVAVKIIHPELTGTTASDRLLLEAHAAARLRHRSIVKVFDFGFSEFGDPYFVMERLHGGNLFDMLQREGALPQEYAVQLMLPIIEAIVAAHAQGIVHRDLKPENIMIVTDDAGCIVPKVLDFGVAKFAASPMGKPQITQGNAILGTPEYMSPEQARGEPDVDDRADIWGLSMILFEMLAGRPPFTASNYLSVLISIIETPTPSLVGVDSELASLVSRGLHKDRAGRWGSAREFGVALADWLIHRGTFEDITTASVRARWNLNSWRPPGLRAPLCAHDPNPSQRIDGPWRRWHAQPRQEGNQGTWCSRCSGGLLPVVAGRRRTDARCLRCLCPFNPCRRRFDCRNDGSPRGREARDATRPRDAPRTRFSRIGGSATDRGHGIAASRNSGRERSQKGGHEPVRTRDPPDDA